MLKTYTTISGDMFDGIAFKVMGSERYKDILINSNLKYKHIYIFSAGVVLTIPEITLKQPNSLPPWKRGDKV